MQRKASNRLGYYGPNEVKQHIWLRDVNWDDLYDKKVKSPFMPEVGGGEGRIKIISVLG